jgi:hypothetical protein
MYGILPEKARLQTEKSTAERKPERLYAPDKIVYLVV